MEAAQRHGVDAVVVDMILVGGISEIVASGIPTVVFVHCFYRALQDMAAGPLGWFLRLRGIDPLGAERAATLQIVAARADLDPVRGAPQLCHTGVVWQGVPSTTLPAQVPRILVSLSTCAFAGQRRMLQNILDAIAPLPVEATVTVGPGIDASGTAGAEETHRCTPGSTMMRSSHPHPWSWDMVVTVRRCGRCHSGCR